MNTAMRVGIALGGAAVVIAGGSAFTDSNTLPATKTLGYGNTTATGVVTTKTTLTPLASDGSKLDSVVWEESNLAITPETHKAMMTLTVSGNPSVTDSNCTIVAATATPTVGTITCTGANAAIANVTGVALTVYAKPGN